MLDKFSRFLISVSIEVYLFTQVYCKVVFGKQLIWVGRIAQSVELPHHGMLSA